MPLSEPGRRELLHLRDIQLRGWQRGDGLFDIEAHLLDRKAYDFENDDRGMMKAGDPLHGMWIRLTIRDDMEIVACEASSDHTPYALCPGAAPNFARLAGLRIGPGFNRAVNERVGGVLGCTHLREVLAQMATVAFQTLYPIRARKEREEAARIAAAGGTVPQRKPELVGTCIAYAPDSPVTLARWPWLRSP
ncbi:DUF2889 domain-containing protein [Siccirubricoccus phaeus]|uniref:DUF2889 domain-containing protein n=1 Tax=Siccirubricoccus phaeus TaxID=2595053 RepID=UPI0011F14BA0|nr:DUF2889 domain-containing protein [Siccirubricoccus phaeus]